MSDITDTGRPPMPLWERRMIVRVMVSGMQSLNEPVPQQMIDFAEGRADDPGPLPDPEKYRNRHRTRWQRLLGR